MTDYRKYWIIKEGKACGPMPREALRGMNAETKVWRQGLPQWTVASQLPELADLIAVPQQPQPQMMPQQPQPTAQTEPQMAAQEMTQEAVERKPYEAPQTHLTAAIITAAIIFLLFFFFLDPLSILRSLSFYVLLLTSLLSIRSAVKARHLWLADLKEAALKRNDRTVALIVFNVVVAITLFPFHVVSVLFF